MSYTDKILHLVDCLTAFNFFFVHFKTMSPNTSANMRILNIATFMMVNLVCG